jgi:hypothetical protein
MTLKQKFSRILPWYSEKDNSNKSNECIKIADDYAIEFSKFIETHCVKTEYLHQYFFQGKEHHIKSLLEIFKKEKYYG